MNETEKIQINVTFKLNLMQTNEIVVITIIKIFFFHPFLLFCVCVFGMDSLSSCKWATMMTFYMSSRRRHLCGGYYEKVKSGLGWWRIKWAPNLKYVCRQKSYFTQISLQNDFLKFVRENTCIGSMDGSEFSTFFHSFFRHSL